MSRFAPLLSFNFSKLSWREPIKGICRRINNVRVFLLSTSTKRAFTYPLGLRGAESFWYSSKSFESSLRVSSWNSIDLVSFAISGCTLSTKDAMQGAKTKAR